MTTQKARILSALKSGKKLTKMEMLREFGCWNSGNIIYQLRLDGHEVVTDMIEAESGKKVARYRL